ncbi:TBC domain-containing protein, putative [Babesia ovata]|uniref:TBC domain-containing protein, putative n=1 Tax=Babesia ovata TaxID=189622 RepID=A0A2H6KAC3_9APIC|nr:TBC domain-containing protein, putative [Babesia ovata]GBE59938.1 TBC domain-containing protein, putative [Babesia ovata]
MRLPWSTGGSHRTVACVILVAERQQECVKQQKNRRREKTKVTQRMLNCVSNYERGALWKRWIKTEHHKAALPKGIYLHLVAFDMPEFDAAIRNDIHRTFPQHAIFTDAKYAQTALFNVLKAYALYNPDVGGPHGKTRHQEPVPAANAAPSEVLLRAGWLRQAQNAQAVLPHAGTGCGHHDYRNAVVPHPVHVQPLPGSGSAAVGRDTRQGGQLHTAHRHHHTKAAGGRRAAEHRRRNNVQHKLLQANQDEIQRMMKDLTPHLSARAIIHELDKHKYEHRATQLLKNYGAV